MLDHDIGDGRPGVGPETWQRAKGHPALAIARLPGPSLGVLELFSKGLSSKGLQRAFKKRLKGIE